MPNMSHSGWKNYACQNIIVNVSKCMEPLFLDPYVQYCKYSHASKFFVYLYIQRINQVQTAFDISGHGELDRWSRLRVIISQQCLRLNLNFLKLATYHTRMAKLLFMYRFNLLFASDDFWCMLIAFANSIGSRSGPTEHQC